MSKKIKVGQLSTYIPSDSTIMVGGFGLVGAPLTILKELENKDIGGLTIISNNLGEQGIGLGKLLLQGKIKKAIGSYFTGNPDAARYYLEGKIDIQLLPQGTLTEAIRCGGAGIGGFYVKTGVGTVIEEGKETRIIRGEKYIFEEPLKADIAIIRAKYADELGNLVFEKSARNFNPVMATAAEFVIAEVDKIVPTGTLDPESIVVPHVFVDKVLCATVHLKDVKQYVKN